MKASLKFFIFGKSDPFIVRYSGKLWMLFVVYLMGIISNIQSQGQIQCETVYISNMTKHVISKSIKYIEFTTILE